MYMQDCRSVKSGLPPTRLRHASDLPPANLICTFADGAIRPAGICRLRRQRGRANARRETYTLAAVTAGELVTGHEAYTSTAATGSGLMGGRRRREPGPTYATMRYINDIIVHCTDTPWDMDATAADIKAWHTLPPPKGNGWRDIGYHYVVRLDGTVERGRAISQPGAHCYGHNAHSVGVVYVGGRDESGRTADTRTAAQKASLLKLLANLTRMYRCRIHSHHDYDAGKACPCFDATGEYAGLYKQLVTEAR